MREKSKQLRLTLDKYIPLSPIQKVDIKSDSILVDKIAQWIYDTSEILEYQCIKNPSIIKKIKSENLSFIDGIKYLKGYLITDLLIKDTDIEELIENYLIPLISCQHDCETCNLYSKEL